MNTDHATNFLFAVEQLQFRFSCGVNALGAIHTAMEGHHPRNVTWMGYLAYIAISAI